MIKTVNGATTMSGDVPTIMADFLSVSDSFIRYITDKFEVNEARAIIGYAALAEIVGKAFKKPDRRTIISNCLIDVLDFLAVDSVNQQPNATAETIVIEADSPEDVMRQVKEVLTDIMKMEGDE